MGVPHNASQLAKLNEGIHAWNEWREQHPDEKVDLSGAVFDEPEWSGLQLGRLNLRGAILREVKLRGFRNDRANLAGADLREADLSGAVLTGADLSQAKLRNAILAGAELNEVKLNEAMLEKADLHGANLSKADLRGAYLAKANLEAASLREATAAAADLSEVNLWKANLSHAHLMSANLRSANLRDAYAVGADLAEANLNSVNLRFANLNSANLSGADLRAAHADYVDLSEADLTGAALFRTGLTNAKLSRARLVGADLRAATLLQADLSEAIANDVRLWESQRAGWTIAGIFCKRAFWDKNAHQPTHYDPGEFERLHSDQACIELFYQGGVSKFELNTLPALLHHLASLHGHASIRLKSIEETGGGAKILISVADADTDTVEKIRSDARQVHQAQLALRDNEILRLETEKKYLESFVSERLIKAMLAATTQQNVFNAPVYGVALSSGNSSAVVHQTVNDNTGLLALLEKILERRAELPLEPADAEHLDAEVDAAKGELGRSEPNPSILSRSLNFVQEMASEAVKKAAGKLGEQAVSADWHSLLHQLNQFTQQFK
jgi:uncharacterized protein YjbI with pentapeptide repeats